MQLRWREHERILVTLLTLLSLAGYCWKMYQFAGRQVNPVFHYYVHVFMPKAAPVLLVYFCFLWINIRLVPQLQLPSGNVPAGTSFSRRVALYLRLHPWPVVQAILLFFLLGVTLSVSAHSPLRGFYATTLLLAAYAAYLVVREMMISYIEGSDDRREYLVMVANRVTTFVAGVTVLMKVVDLLNFVDSWRAAAAFYAFILSSFLMGMSNIYWLYPKYGKERFFNGSLLFRLLLITFTCALLMYTLFLVDTHDYSRPVPFAMLWIYDLFIVTPVSWWLYLYRKDKILQLRGMEKALIQSRSSLAFLQSQINPHFLFNALNTLYGTALQEQADRTAEGIQKLGDMMRFMLHENHLEQIKMSREIEYLENYISLQKLRTATSAAIVIEDDIGAAHCDHTIAPMLLIPFVENAFKHGISLQEKSWIKISLRCDEQHIYFETRNSVHARPAGNRENDDPGIGLNNVRERLKWLYPGRYELEVNGNAEEFLVKLVIRT